MKFRHRSPAVDVFVWNDEGAADLPLWVKQFGARISLDQQVESDRFGVRYKDMLFYNTIEHENDYDYQPYITRGDILLYDPNEGVRGMTAAYFNRNYEPVV